MHSQSIRIEKGIVHIERVNFTRNKTIIDTALNMIPNLNDISGIGGSIKYCTIHNNTANNGRIIQIDCSTINTIIMFCNIIKNKQL